MVVVMEFGLRSLAMSDYTSLLRGFTMTLHQSSSDESTGIGMLCPGTR